MLMVTMSFVILTFRSTTSKAEIRSVATKRRLDGSDVAYISRTLPFDTRLSDGKLLSSSVDMIPVSDCGIH